MADIPVKWAAQVAHVREVSLLGAADLSYWQSKLSMQNLVPSESIGQAQLLLIAGDARYLGLRFQELSISVLVTRNEVQAGSQAAYLVQAFNSSRLLTWCERTFFATPYRHGDVCVSLADPTAIRLVKAGEVLFDAEMRVGAGGLAREACRSGDDGWQGPKFLPPRSPRRNHRGRVFHANLRGYTQTYPFDPSLDALEIRPSADSDVLQMLLDSHFFGQEWIVRPDATHARSKTYRAARV